METYTQIKEYPDYEISNNGNVRNIKTKRILKPRLHTRGYYMIINIYKNKKSYTIPIHRLVAINYVDNPDMFNDVDHIDRNKLNNNSSNLRWVSHEDNMINRLYKKDLLYYCDISNKFVVQAIKNNKNYYYDNLSEAVTMFKSLL